MFRVIRCFAILELITLLCLAQSSTDKPAAGETSGASQLAPAPSPKSDLLREAYALYSKGNFRDALPKYKALLEEKPKSPDGWAGLIRTYLKGRDIAAAAQSAERALSVADHPRVRTARAEVLFRQGDIDRAEKEWAEVVNSGYPEGRAY